MAPDTAKADLEARLATLEARIAELRSHSAATSGVPHGQIRWDDIVDSHRRLADRIADEREPDAAAFERLRADVEALALTLDSWMKGVDRHFAATRRPEGGA